jgi:hypothetical protein
LLQVVVANILFWLGSGIFRELAKFAGGSSMWICIFVVDVVSAICDSEAASPAAFQRKLGHV